MVVWSISNNDNYFGIGYYYDPKEGLQRQVVISGRFSIDEMCSMHDYIKVEIDEQAKNSYYGWRHG